MTAAAADITNRAGLSGAEASSAPARQQGRNGEWEKPGRQAFAACFVPQRHLAATCTCSRKKGLRGRACAACFHVVFFQSLADTCVATACAWFANNSNGGPWWLASMWTPPEALLAPAWRRGQRLLGKAAGQAFTVCFHAVAWQSLDTCTAAARV